MYLAEFEYAVSQTARWTTCRVAVPPEPEVCACVQLCERDWGCPDLAGFSELCVDADGPPRLRKRGEFSCVGCAVGCCGSAFALLLLFGAVVGGTN